MAKEITLEDLAGMVNNGLESIRSEINDGFEKVNKRFDTLENKVEHVEADAKDIKLHLHTETYKFDIKDLDNRVTKLEEKIA